MEVERQKAFRVLAPVVTRAVIRQVGSHVGLERADLVQEALARVWEVLGNQRVLHLPPRERILYCRRSGVNAARALVAATKRAYCIPAGRREGGKVRLTLRVPPDIYRELFAYAQAHGVSATRMAAMIIARHLWRS